MIIALVNSKGGVGKSTIAGNLAAWLFDKGYRVTLVDCDTQSSSSEWMEDVYPEMKVLKFDAAEDVLDELPELSQEADYVICDGPGSQTEMSRALLMWADLAIIPCKASMFEARALDKNTRFVRQAQAIRRGEPKAVAVLSMVGRGYRLTRDMKHAADALEMDLANIPVSLRQAYADAPGQGTVVWRMGTKERDAANEIDALFRELIPQACEQAQTKLLKQVNQS